jgi:hypothetical protein
MDMQTKLYAVLHSLLSIIAAIIIIIIINLVRLEFTCTQYVFGEVSQVTSRAKEIYGTTSICVWYNHKFAVL